jgi:flagellar basal body-associated protein FliL
MRLRTILTVTAIVLGVVVLGCGIAAVVLAHTNAVDLTDRLKQESVSLRVFDENAPEDAVISNSAQARTAADTLNEHRKGIAPTYSDLLGGKRFDPTDPKQLTYMAGMTLEGQLNTAALAFGLTTVLTFNGIVMIVIGIALIVTATAIWAYHMHHTKKEKETPATA